MGCCGEKIKKVISMATGHISAADRVIRDMFHLPAHKYRYADRRIRACRDCSMSTWMTTVDYSRWLFDNLKGVILDIDALDMLPPLPKRENRRGGKLICSICKCWVCRKAYVEDEKCPLSNPAWEINES